MGLFFTWDDRKAAINLRKHGITFEEAASIFGDPLLMTIPDRKHSNGEERFFSLGKSREDRLLAVAHTESRDWVHIINARKASRKETKTYEEGEDN
jgi:uncharacterized DUF497 family protein